MRLIDAYKMRCDRDDYDTYADYITAFDAINDAPTVDAVPVIRCKDCRYWENYSSSTVNPNVHRCKYWHIGTEWDDYCKRADRKE